MFGQGVAIRHSGNVIRHKTQTACFVLAHGGCPHSPLARHLLGMDRKMVEQPLHDRRRLVADFHHAGVPVHVGIEERFQRGVGSYKGIGKGDQRAASRPHVGSAGGLCLPKPSAALGNRILHKSRDDPPADFMNDPAPLQPWMQPVNLRQDFGQKIDFAEVAEVEQSRAQAIVDIMGIVGDIVRNRRCLRLGAGETAQFQRISGVKFEDGEGHAAFAIFLDGIWAGQRAVVLDQTFECFPGQIQPVETSIPPLQPCDDAQSLRVVVKTTVFRHARLKSILSRVPEGRVSQIMGQRQSFGEVIIQTERTGQSAGDLADFNRMGQPGAVMIAFMRYENLGFMGETAEGGRVDDTVSVTLKGCASRG